ncbi:MAG: ComF family protein [Acetobacteraceae bacterium]
MLLPPQCVACDAPVQAQGQLCPACFRAMTFLTDPVCRRCGVPFDSEGQAGFDHLCAACLESPPQFGEARAALSYDDGARRLILPFKHGDRLELASVLATHMARAGAAILARAEVLVPVPLHRLRLFKRRYNQAALLARAIGSASGVAVAPDALRRIRATPSLDHRGAAERAAAVAGAFVVRPSRVAAIRGRAVVLIDDVVTSGATANAATLALLAAGARSVDVLAAARVPDPRR